MRDLADLTGDPEPVPTDHGTCTFAELTVREIARLLRERRDARRAQLLDDYRACGQTAEQTADALDRLADRTWDAQSMADLAADRIDGQPSVLLASLRKSHADAAEAMLDAVQLDDEQRFALAAQVLGLSLSYADPQAGSQTPQADAETGRSTPTSSSGSGPASGPPLT